MFNSCPPLFKEMHLYLKRAFGGIMAPLDSIYSHLFFAFFVCIDKGEREESARDGCNDIAMGEREESVN